MSADAHLIPEILAFLDRVGIRHSAEPVGDDTLLPGATVRHGVLVFDPKLPWPGDLLHEAGHIAVTDPAVRDTLPEVRDDPAEEMAAIAWSYAAAVELGIDPEVLFHEAGYRGGSEALRVAMTSELPPGVPMLAWFGMTNAARGAAPGSTIYPRMDRWLR